MVPNDRVYTRSHLWVKLNEAQVLVGVTEPLLRRLEPVTFVELPDPHDEMMPDVPFGEIEGLHQIHQLYPPADAEVLEVNRSLQWSVDKLMEDPYGEGWLMRIKAHDPEQLKCLMNAESYEAFCAEQFQEKVSNES